jgi:hypothetical protein
MRHEYVGDVGDFGKYGLLRALGLSEPSYRLGMIWYLTDGVERGNDGRHDGYLKNGSIGYRESFRRCDQDLYDVMARIRRAPQLNIKLVEKCGILARNTRYYNRALPDGPTNGIARLTTIQHWIARNQWHSEAMETVIDADYVFTDPDNGILFPTGEDESMRSVKPSRKHSYWHELNAFLSRGNSVVAYHHLGRRGGGHVEQIANCLKRIKSLGHDAMAIHYRRGSARAFFVIPTSVEHKEWLFGAAQMFATNWAAHCAVVSAR